MVVMEWWGLLIPNLQEFDSAHYMVYYLFGYSSVEKIKGNRFI